MSEVRGLFRYVILEEELMIVAVGEGCFEQSSDEVKDLCQIGIGCLVDDLLDDRIVAEFLEVIDDGVFIGETVETKGYWACIIFDEIV